MERYKKAELYRYPPYAESAERVVHLPIVCIQPPSPHLADERVFPNLGLAYLAEIAAQNGNPVEYLDLSGVTNYKDVLHKIVSQSPARHFAFTATTPQIPVTFELAHFIKEHRRDAVLILGGPHATLTHAAWKQDLDLGIHRRGTAAFLDLVQVFDRIVAGDGEKALFTALDPLNASSIIDAAHIQSPLFIQRSEYPLLPIMKREFLDISSYRFTIDDKNATSVIGQRGCPFGCGFCGGRSSHTYRLARNRDIDSIIEEIQDIVTSTHHTDRPIEAIMFYDDELNVSPDNLESLCTALLQLQIALETPMSFRGFIKSELFTPTQAQLMYRAGFREVLIGIESGSDKILTAMNKHTSVEKNTACIRYAHEAGLSCKALMSIGHPGESMETIEASINWAVDHLLPGDAIDWTVITQYPGSPYFDQSVYDGTNNAWVYTTEVDGIPLRLWSSAINYTEVSAHYKGVPGEYFASVWTDYLSSAELVSLRDHAEQVTNNHLQRTQIKRVSTTLYDHSMGLSIPSWIYLSNANPD